MSHLSSTDFHPVLGLKKAPFTFLQNIGNQQVRCDIVFGMPSQDCRGTGICKISSDGYEPANSRKECRRTTAFASRTGDGQKVSLVFFRALICTNLFHRHFRKGILKMPEPCFLPPDLIANLGLKGNALLPGDYRIEAVENSFRIEISCGFC